MKTISIILTLLLPIFSVGQSVQELDFNKNYPEIKLDKKTKLKYALRFEKNGVYKVSVWQHGIDVVLKLTNSSDEQLLEKDSPNGTNGLETFSYTSNEKGKFYLSIDRLDENGNPEQGKVSIFIKKYSKSEIEEIKTSIEPENAKNVQTLDIDHFWEAFDHLKKCKTHSDSVATIQTLYLDRATNGLLDFIQARSFTAEKFVRQIAHYPKFYASVRKNTIEAKKSEPVIEEVFQKFSELYPNFKPFKVCFAIGLINTGGTTSNQFVLIGTEVSASTKGVDVSEFGNSAFGKVLISEGDILQKLRNMIAHECVHTQQITPYDKDAVFCGLLYNIMTEGFCDFIGELVVGDQINQVAFDYGERHEKDLWVELKRELCNENSKNWLYNYFTSQERPADLGYYVGYKIAQEYYKNASDKRKAIADIIEMNNPIRFLELSRYDQKPKG